MHPVLHRVRSTAIQKLVSAGFLCLLGLLTYVAVLAGGGWWLALLLTTSALGIEAQPPAWFFQTAACTFGGLFVVEWFRRKKRHLEPAPDHTSWLRVPMDLLLLGPGCLFSLWDLAGSAARILHLDSDAINDVLGAMGPSGSIPIFKLSGVLEHSPRSIERTIHAMQLLDLIYIAERNGALALVATDGQGKTLCRTLRHR